MKKIPIENFDYYASEDGFIYNKHGVKMKMNLTHNGYYRITFQRKKSYFVHRLIGLTYISNPNNYEFINHINGIKTDNSVNNLEWCNSSMNMQHAYDNRLCNREGEKHHLSKLTEKDVIEIRNLYHVEKICQKTLAARFNTTSRNISFIVNNKRWTHI